MVACTAEDILDPSDPKEYVKDITDAFLMMPADIFDSAKSQEAYYANRGSVAYEFYRHSGSSWACVMTGEESYAGATGTFLIESTDVSGCYHITVSGSHNSGELVSTFSADIDETADKHMVMQVNLYDDGLQTSSYTVSYNERGKWFGLTIKKK